jgi:hypothetical protein
MHHENIEDGTFLPLGSSFSMPARLPTPDQVAVALAIMAITGLVGLLIYWLSGLF